MQIEEDFPYRFKPTVMGNVCLLMVWKNSSCGPEEETWKRRKEVGGPARGGEALGKEGEAPMERKADMGRAKAKSN